MVIGYAFHVVLFICKGTKLFCCLQVFTPNIPLKSVKLTLRFDRKTKLVLRLVIDAINTSNCSDEHGLGVCSLRNQSL